METISPLASSVRRLALPLLLPPLLPLAVYVLASLAPLA
jgi:hypothetical protein